MWTKLAALIQCNYMGSLFKIFLETALLIIVKSGMGEVTELITLRYSVFNSLKLDTSKDKPT